MADHAATVSHVTRKRRVRTGPLPTLPRGDLAPVVGLEGRLPFVIVAGFVALAAIQVALAL